MSRLNSRIAPTTGLASHGSSQLAAPDGLRYSIVSATALRDEVLGRKSGQRHHIVFGMSHTPSPKRLADLLRVRFFPSRARFLAYSGSDFFRW